MRWWSELHRPCRPTVITQALNLSRCPPFESVGVPSVPNVLTFAAVSNHLIQLTRLCQHFSLSVERRQGVAPCLHPRLFNSLVRALNPNICAAAFCRFVSTANVVDCGCYSNVKNLGLTWLRTINLNYE